MGKDRLTIDDVSAMTGVSKDYLSKLEKTGRLDLNDVGVAKDVPLGGQEKELAKAHAQGATMVNMKTRRQSAEETFMNFWKQPIGEARVKDPRTFRETNNEADGIPIDFVGDPTSRADLQKNIKDEDKFQDDAAADLEKRLANAKK